MILKPIHFNFQFLTSQIQKKSSQCHKPKSNFKTFRKTARKRNKITRSANSFCVVCLPVKPCHLLNIFKCFTPLCFAVCCIYFVYDRVQQWDCLLALLTSQSALRSSLIAFGYFLYSKLEFPIECCRCLNKLMLKCFKLIVLKFFCFNWLVGCFACWLGSVSRVTVINRLININFFGFRFIIFFLVLT